MPGLVREFSTKLTPPTISAPRNSARRSARKMSANMASREEQATLTPCILSMPLFLLDPAVPMTSPEWCWSICNAACPTPPVAA